jgi:HlyD family secretion protein
LVGFYSKQETRMSTPQTDVLNAIGLGKSKKASHWHWWVLAAVVVAGGLYAWSLQDKSAAKVSYVTRDASMGKLLVTVTSTGTLQPTNQVEVGSEVSGIMQSVAVNYNDHVEVGQILAQLDTQTLEARLASSEASLAVAQAALAQAAATRVEAAAKLARSRDLFGRKLLAEQALETDEAAALRAAAAEKSAQAQVTSAAASLREAKTSLSKAVIRSPISGMVISRDIDPGQTVAATFQTPVLFTVAEDLSHMELRLDVDESDIGQIREGQKASFRVDAYPGRSFTAKIISVHFKPLEVNNIVTYETVLAVDNSDLSLRPGMTATADIEIVEKASVLLVPNQALRFLPSEEDASTDQAPRVWKEQAGNAVPVAVTVGLSNGEVTEILGGEVKAGEALIVDLVREARALPDGGPF